MAILGKTGTLAMSESDILIFFVDVLVSVLGIKLSSIPKHVFLFFYVDSKLLSCPGCAQICNLLALVSQSVRISCKLPSSAETAILRTLQIYNQFNITTN